MYEPIRTKSVHAMADDAQYPHPRLRRMVGLTGGGLRARSAVQRRPWLDAAGVGVGDVAEVGDDGAGHGFAVDDGCASV
jgi:hypothetical protein